MNMLKTMLCIMACSLSASAFAEPPKVANGMVVDDEGMTLYRFDRDTVEGQSACSGGCATLWPAALADSYDKPSGEWGVMATAQGKRQWTYEGHPLYRFSGDKKPGETNGDGFRGVWHVAKP